MRESAERAGRRGATPRQGMGFLFFSVLDPHRRAENTGQGQIRLTTFHNGEKCTAAENAGRSPAEEHTRIHPVGVGAKSVEGVAHGTDDGIPQSDHPP